MDSKTHPTEAHKAKARELALEKAAALWGEHPYGWPTPPIHRPGRLALLFGARPEFEKLESVFGGLDQVALNRFWSQPGQSPYEDAGGAMLRRYKAMIGLPVERLPTYAEFVEGLSDGGKDD